MNNFELLEGESDGSEYLKFNRVETKLSQRRDLHAFMLLDRLFPNTGDMISAAGHDEFYLDVSEDQIESISKEHAIELNRCGVMYNGYGLRMFT